MTPARAVMTIGTHRMRIDAWGRDVLEYLKEFPFLEGLGPRDWAAYARICIELGEAVEWDETSPTTPSFRCGPMCTAGGTRSGSSQSPVILVERYVVRAALIAVVAALTVVVSAVVRVGVFSPVGSMRGRAVAAATAHALMATAIV